MKSTIHSFYFLLLFQFVPAAMVAQEKTNESLHFGAAYIGDLVTNINGGIKTGTAYLGLATIDAGFDTEKAKWWKGGAAFVKLANTHGGEPSANLVGDFQGVSNIEAGPLTWLYELWYRQRFGNLSVTVGLQDLNVNFAADECAAGFTNSSFGIHSSIADNIPSPIFPLTALGVNLNWDISPSMVLKMAVFDGTPDDLENNPYNIHWQLSREQGVLTVGELQLNRSLFANKRGNYKIGGYFHQHNDSTNEEQQNGGIYFAGNQQITDKIDVFSQIGLSPKRNNHNHYYSIGLKYSDIFKNRPDDYMGMAVAYAGIDSNPNGGETVIEIIYQCQICSNVYIRPDIQYIVNPAGTDQKLGNALVAMMRFGVEF